MISENELDIVLQNLEENTIDVGEFYAGMGEKFPGAVSWLISDPGPLTSEEHDYLLFLGTVILTIAKDNDLSDPDPDRIESLEENLWETLNKDLGRGIESQADIVDDDDAVGIFLIDALHPDDEMPFLTKTGSVLMYCRLMALVKAY